MKLISCLFFLFLIEMYNAKRSSNPPNIIRIPLKKIVPKMKKSNSARASSQVLLDDSYTYNLATISFGTPKQNLDVMLDTGSDNTWVFSKKYDFIDPYANLVFSKHHSYSRVASSTYIPRDGVTPDLFRYPGTTWVFGYRATDVITMGGYGIGADFTEVTMAEEFFPKSRMDGILSLKYNPKSGNIVTRICDTIKGEKKFSYFLPLVKNSIKGEITLCGEDKSKYDEGRQVKYVNEIDPGTWRVVLDSLSVDEPGRPIVLTRQSAAQIDTGTPYIWGPISSIAVYKDRISKHLRGNPDDLEIECAHKHLLPLLDFKFGGHSYHLNGLEYTSQSTNSNLCKILLKSHKDEYWRIGDPFLRRYITVFDIRNHQVGMIRSKGD